jgi:hypothetical protein
LGYQVIEARPGKRGRGRSSSRIFSLRHPEMSKNVQETLFHDISYLREHTSSLPDFLFAIEDSRIKSMISPSTVDQNDNPSTSSTSLRNTSPILQVRRCNVNWDASATGRQYLIWIKEIPPSWGLALTVLPLYKPTTTQRRSSIKILYD